GYVPVLKSVKENAAYKNNFLDLADGGDFIAALSAKVCLEQESAYYVSPAFYGSSIARDEVGKLMQACFSQVTTNVDQLIDESFKYAVDQCEYNS
ncbi:MAG: hypothetical protein ACI3XE_00390, partial [Eubacteriales bacterium]